MAGNIYISTKMLYKNTSIAHFSIFLQSPQLEIQSSRGCKFIIIIIIITPPPSGLIYNNTQPWAQCSPTGLVMASTSLNLFVLSKWQKIFVGFIMLFLSCYLDKMEELSYLDFGFASLTWPSCEVSRRGVPHKVTWQHHNNGVDFLNIHLPSS